MSQSFNLSDYESVKLCSLCGSSQSSDVYELRGSFATTSILIKECTTCGNVFSTPRLREKNGRRLYDEAYFHGNGFDPNVSYATPPPGRQELECAAMQLRLKAFGRSTSDRILDVGCGTGSLLRSLAQAGYRRTDGVELSEYAARSANTHAKVRVFQGDFLDQVLQDRYEIVNASEVIEHVYRPSAFFRRIAATLESGGLFLFTTGNYDSLYSKAFGARWPYFMDGHLVYYRAKTLHRFLIEAGLEPAYLWRLPWRRRLMFLWSEAILNRARLRDMAPRLFQDLRLLPLRLLIDNVLVGGLLGLFVGRCTMPLGAWKRL